MSEPANQSQHQVRFDWGGVGARAMAPGAHILARADTLPGGPDFLVRGLRAARDHRWRTLNAP